MFLSYNAISKTAVSGAAVYPYHPFNACLILSLQNASVMSINLTHSANVTSTFPLSCFEICFISWPCRSYSSTTGPGAGMPLK